LAKDSPSAPGFDKARQLAALVIQELGADVIKVMAGPPAKRANLMEETVMKKIRHYLRPPDPKDPWWNSLISQGGQSIDARLADVQSKTPLTVNQAPFSPLRNLEASKDSPMAMPLGLAAPIGGRTWLQVGGGVTRPPALDPRLPASDTKDTKSVPFFGAQITGHF
jgi:hypothetical protein